jgi:hypothetical protein
MTVVLEDEWLMPVRPAGLPRFVLCIMHYARRLGPTRALAQSFVDERKIGGKLANGLPLHTGDD